MQFDFDRPFPNTHVRQSQKIQDILQMLQNRSDHGSHKNDMVNFSNFGQVEEEKSVQKSYVSEMFNQPKQASIPQSKQKPQKQFDQDTSRDIGEISYLYSNNESFRFERSMSFELPESKESSRFQKLKNLLSQAKKNNLDAFYRNIEQATNENNQGNIEFQNKTQFKQYTRNMRLQKRQEENRFQTVLEEKKIQAKTATKNVKANLFGVQAAEAFKKKNTFQPNILPLEYTQEDKQEEQIDFFYNGSSIPNKEHYEDDQFAEKKISYIKEGQQFFEIGNGPKQPSNLSKKAKAVLLPIRQQKHTMLDHSMQQRKFQQLILNYKNMKGNYNVLMQQLKQTSKGQFELMDQMQKIKHDYNVQQTKQQQSQHNSTEQKTKKKQEKQKIKHIKQKQLAQIKHQIHQIKATTTQKDVAYLKINQKIEQLQQIVRAALQEVQQQKHEKQNFTPKIINYFDNRVQQADTPRSQKQQFDQSQQPSLSRQSQNLYEVQNTRNQPYSNSLSRKQIANPKDRKPNSKHTSKMPSNINSHNNSIKRQNHQKSGYMEKNSIKDQLNFIDEFSSPLQLDLSVDAHNTSEEFQQNYDIPFGPPEYALQYLPLKLDQGQTKNLRSILTQKSSILYESFQFLVTVRYTMQDDELYPIVGNLRVANKCAIDLLDIFVLVYGPQGQNIEVTPNKIFQQRLKFNSNIFFQVKLDKTCIDDNGFNVQVCYKTDSITKKKVNFKALLPIVQLIRPEFCYEQNFLDSWDLFKNEIYIRPRKLNFKQIRNHEDLKLVLPFIHISQQDPNTFSYGLMFRYPRSKTMFMLKISCYINGKASVHLRSDKNGDQKLKQQLLNIINFLFLN